MLTRYEWQKSEPQKNAIPWVEILMFAGFLLVGIIALFLMLVAG